MSAEQTQPLLPEDAEAAAADIAVPFPEHASVISTYAKRCVLAAWPLILASELDAQANDLEQQAAAFGVPRLGTPASGMVTVLNGLAEDFRARAAELRGDREEGQQ